MASIQSVIFDKKKYSLQKAKSWLRKEGMKTDVDVKRNTYRFRQKEPNKRKKYFTKTLTNGVKAVMFNK